ncbi:hypothetical protein TSUD_278580 [Trifolium subterraneum]|uniref:Reverse transcriptase zinc-binding domain-containing protein n=1 Tax=Trifolium subterraneum TaxID=3900 RepID=A0A2Z6M8H7_TRISU|nr:hypothetical protein TSUD_278580 [Trifolium subterraneum]
MLGLKVNFNKSILVGVNIPVSWLGEAASALCCKVGKIPFLYLGFSIGGNPRRLGFWDPVLTRFKTRLSGWKSRFLCFGGRLVLLMFVLTSLPVYALSFFKAPSARYGIEGGRLREGGRRGSSWWREIGRLGRVVSLERFGRLFDPAETKLRTVAEMFALGWGAEGEAWEWRRPLRVWEEDMLGECQSLFTNISLRLNLQIGGSDSLTLLKATLSGALISF